MANDPKIQTATHPDKYKTRNDFLHDFCAGKVCAEIGVAQGSFSAEILKHNPAKLYLIDCWQQQSQEAYPADSANAPQNEMEANYRNVMQYLAPKPNVVVKRAFSFDAAQEFPDKFFEFIFIDAVHTLPMCLADLVAWWPKIKPGGVLTGHDLNIGQIGAPGTVNFCPALSVYAALKQFLFLIHREKLDVVTYEQDSWGIFK
jgi:hypothetical protein